MSKYIYKDGAIHHDHHKEMTVNVSGKTDVATILKAFMADDIMDVEEVKEEMDCNASKITPSPEKIQYEEKAVKKSRGRKPEPLLSDEIIQQNQAKIFVDFLKLHNRSNYKIDTTKNNYINRAFAAFYQQWIKEKLVPSYPNGNACYRFLKEECKLAFKVDDVKTYGTFIRNYINDNAVDIDDIKNDIEDFLMT